MPVLLNYVSVKWVSLLLDNTDFGGVMKSIAPPAWLFGRSNLTGLPRNYPCVVFERSRYSQCAQSTGIHLAYSG